METGLQTRGFLSACLMLTVLALLGVATLVDLFDGPGTPRDERIAATPAQPTNSRAIRAFPGDARFYLARRYAMKDVFKALQSRVMLALFGRAAATNVMAGRSDMLFLDNADALATSFGAAGLAPERAKAWEAFFARVEAETGRPFVLLAAPNKHSVYRDALPEWAPADPLGEKRITRIVRAAAAAGIAAPDLSAHFATLRGSDPGTLLYHRSDTHWNELGAAAAVSLALDRDPGFTFTHSPTHGGDLARLLALTASIRETIPVIDGPGEITCRTPDGASYSPVIFDPLPEKRFTCSGPDGTRGSAMVFMDSFGMSTVPSISRLFDEVHFVWEAGLDRSAISKVDPDLVVLVVVERTLQQLDPKGLIR